MKSENTHFYGHFYSHIVRPALMCGVALGVLGLLSDAAQADFNQTYNRMLENAGESDQLHGIRVGGLLLLPALGVKTEYSDNIDNASSGQKMDVVTSSVGSVALKTNWNRHMLLIGTSGQRTLYKHTRGRDFGTVGYFARGRYDFTEATFLKSSVSYGQQHISRGTADDIDPKDPIDYTVANISAGFERSLSYIKLQIGGSKGIAEIDDKSVALITDYETKNSQAISGGLTYERSPGNAVYLRASYSQNDYDLVSGLLRDTDTLDLRTGLDFNTGSLYSGGIYGSWQRRQDSSVADIDDLFFVGGYLHWDITTLTGLTYSYNKSYSEGQVSANDSALTSSHKLTLSNSFTRLVNTDFSVQMDDYDYSVAGGSTAQNSQFLLGKIETRYAVTDSLDLNLGLAHQRRDSGTSTNDYRTNQVYLSLTYRQ